MQLQLRGVHFVENQIFEEKMFVPEERYFIAEQNIGKN